MHKTHAGALAIWLGEHHWRNGNLKSLIGLSNCTHSEVGKNILMSGFMILAEGHRLFS